MRPYAAVCLIALMAVPGASAQQPDSSAAAFKATAAPRTPRPRYSAETLRRRPDFVESMDLSKKVGWLARGGYVGMNVLTSADERTTYLIIRRTTSSQPEAHARWDDFVIVRSGTGAVVFGDSLEGSTLRAPGERRGGTIIGAHQLVVSAGDVVRIPAAVPHAFIVSGTEPLEYLVIKTRRQELPVRWYVGQK